jgi:proline iminopeptidase
VDSEGFVNIGGLRVFYRSVGDPNHGTLLGLHGGPGGSYDYLSPLFDLADSGYRVVLYDQSGGGKSEAPKSRATFTAEHFVEEVEGLRKVLRLGKVHLYGHSWGGMLAQAYALKHQRNLSSLILSGTTSSVPMLEEEARQVVRGLSKSAREAIAKYESADDFENPSYLAAIDEFNKKHQCRLDPWPETVKFAFEHFSKPVGETMFGLYSVDVTGNMRYWDVTERLETLKLPCLILCGSEDFLTPKLHKRIHSKIRGSRLVVFEGVSHASMWEARKEYVGTIRDFLAGQK